MTAQQDIVKFVKQLRKQIEAVTSKKVMAEIGALMVQMVVKRTRNGFGVQETGSASKPLKKLSPKYVAFRKRSPRLNTSLTSPGRSNLTFTGAMLNSIRVTSVRTGAEARVTIGAGKQRRKGGVTNEQIAEFVAAQGREFLNLSRSELERVSKFIDSRLSTVLAKNL